MNPAEHSYEDLSASMSGDKTDTSRRLARLADFISEQQKEGRNDYSEIAEDKAMVRSLKEIGKSRLVSMGVPKNMGAVKLHFLHK